MAHRESDEDDEIRDVEEVDEKEIGRPKPARRGRYDDDEFEDEEDVDVVKTLIPYKNGLALGAYYCGVFGLVPPLGIVLGPIALILGIFGLIYSRRNPSAKGGIHAITGIVLGVLDIPISIGATILFVMKK